MISLVKAKSLATFRETHLCQVQLIRRLILQQEKEAFEFHLLIPYFLIGSYKSNNKC